MLCRHRIDVLRVVSYTLGTRNQLPQHRSSVLSVWRSSIWQHLVAWRSTSDLWVVSRTASLGIGSADCVLSPGRNARRVGDGFFWSQNPIGTPVAPVVRFFRSSHSFNPRTEAQNRRGIMAGTWAWTPEESSRFSRSVFTVLPWSSFSDDSQPRVGCYPNERALSSTSRLLKQRWSGLFETLCKQPRPDRSFAKGRKWG